MVRQHLLNLTLQPPVLTGGEGGEAAPYADQHHLAAGGAEEFGNWPALPAKKINIYYFIYIFIQNEVSFASLEKVSQLSKLHLKIRFIYFLAKKTVSPFLCVNHPVVHYVGLVSLEADPHVEEPDSQRELTCVEFAYILSFYFILF